MKKNKVELLAPAGNSEKLKYAFHYGADAVYAGVPDFSLRVRINNFTRETIREAVEYAHENKKKIYLTLNIYAHNAHIEKIIEHLKFLKKIKPDGIILSDPGILMLVKKYLPKVEIHLSTQANATNWQAVKFWHEQGVKRVILAREVTLDEIKEIKKKVPKVELEYFIHGAMCMSYSGRCILSKWMTGRSANLGDCTQPCRWLYRQTRNLKRETEREFVNMGVVDDQNRFEIDLEEDQHGTYFFNSYDMNMIEHVDKLIEAGIDSLKIEGRAKSIYYLSAVVKSYRKVIDAIESGQSKQKRKKAILEAKSELDKLVHRGYSTGFLLGNEPAHNFNSDQFKTSEKFVGEAEGVKDNLNVIRVHNEIYLKDELEAITPDEIIPLKIKKIFDHEMKEIEEAHGGHDKRYYFEFNKILPEKSLLRVIAE